MAAAAPLLCLLGGCAPMRGLLKTREAAGRYLSRKLIPSSFTVISDDCWGGQLYRQLQIPYTTPTVGLYIEPTSYLDFVSNLQRPNAFELQFIETDKSYPVAQTPYATVHFMHYADESEVRGKFTRRCQRIDFSHLLVKIDFGKPEYTANDIERWNELKLPNSLAIYPPSIEHQFGHIHHGVAIPDWTIDGAKLFNISRRYVNMHSWLTSGVVRNTALYQLMNLLIFDPTAPRRLLSREKPDTTPTVSQHA